MMNYALHCKNELLKCISSIRFQDFVAEKFVRRNSLSELSTNKTPPPIPPLPLNYTAKATGM